MLSLGCSLSQSEPTNVADCSLSTPTTILLPSSLTTLSGRSCHRTNRYFALTVPVNSCQDKIVCKTKLHSPCRRFCTQYVCLSVCLYVYVASLYG